MKPDAILPAVASRLGVGLASVRFLRYSQNFVYEFVDGRGLGKVLRITSDSHRTLAEICGELDWVCFLRDAGVSVCAPVAYEDGSLAYSIADMAETFHCVVFEKAAGRPLEKGGLRPELYRLHGKHLGMIHALSKEFPQERLGMRKRWDEERYFTSDIGSYLPESFREPVRKVFCDLQLQMNSAGVTKETFGPIHFDLGYSNFHLDGERLEIFDFDNCTNGYFVSDISAALYSSVFHFLRCAFPGDRSAFESPQSGMNLEEVWEPFCEGYRSANGWIEEWNEQLPVWFEIMYFRSVVHAWRVQHPIRSRMVSEALNEDVENILRRKLPMRFDFKTGKAIL